MELQQQLIRSIIIRLLIPQYSFFFFILIVYFPLFFYLYNIKINRFDCWDIYQNNTTLYNRSKQWNRN